MISIGKAEIKASTLIIPLLLFLLNGIHAYGQNQTTQRFDPSKFWSTRELKEGMKGYGLTVFKGTQVERFEVEIIGILYNEMVGMDMILVRCAGGPLEKTGVIAGMSGSPIYIEERMIGALAYAWGFSKDPIAGVTPIENMLPVLDLPATESTVKTGTATPLHQKLSGTGILGEAWDSKVSTFLQKDYEKSLTSSAIPSPLLGNQPSGHQSSWESWWQEPSRLFKTYQTPKGWIPLSTPLSISGLSSPMNDRIASLFEPMGFRILPGGLPSVMENPPASFEPGGAIGVSLISGHLNASGIGTVTYVDGNRVLGFGHPMFNDGATDLPIATAYITTVLPSISLSTKMGVPIEIKGALEQDRASAIGGTIGGKAKTVPLSIHIHNQAAGIDRTYQFEVAHHRFYTSRFASMCVWDAFDITQRGSRDNACEFTVKVTLKNHPSIFLKDRFSSTSGMSINLSTQVAALLDLLMKNPYERVEIESIEIEIETREEFQRTTIESLSLDRQTVQPGEKVWLTVGLRHLMEEIHYQRFPLVIPDNTTPGFLQIDVQDVSRYLGDLQKRNPDRFKDRSLDNLISLINEVYRNDQLFFTLSLVTPGISTEGNEMPNLPTSVLRVLYDSPVRGTGNPVLNEILVSDRINLPTPVSGNQKILVQVEPPKDKRIH